MILFNTDIKLSTIVTMIKVVRFDVFIFVVLFLLILSVFVCVASYVSIDPSIHVFPFAYTVVHCMQAWAPKRAFSYIHHWGFRVVPTVSMRCFYKNIRSFTQPLVFGLNVNDTIYLIFPPLHITKCMQWFVLIRGRE